MSENYFVRSYDLLPKAKLSTPIVIFGCGSIGSYAALALAKAGFNNLTLLDHDTVDFENIGPQFFELSQIEDLKTEALADNIEKFSGTICRINEQKFTYDTVKDQVELCKYVDVNTIVICAIDSMQARAHLHYLLQGMQYKAFIDSRMAIEFLELYAYLPEHTNSIKNYAKTLYTDKDAVQAPCTNKAISYTSLIAGGSIAKLCKDIVLDRLTTYSVKFDISTLTSDILEVK